MRAWYLAPLALAALLFSGCRSDGNQELIERELRFQETELWRLHDEIDSLHSDLESAWRENESLKKELATGDAGAAPGGGTPGRIPSPKLKGPSGGVPSPKVELPGVEMPGVELPGEETPPPTMRPSRYRPLKEKRPASEVGVPMIEPGIEMSPGEPVLPGPGAPEELPPLGAKQGKAQIRKVSHEQPQNADRHVAKIVLNKQLTGGRNADDQPGDEALSVVFEPRNAAGQMVKITGEVSIVVLDSTQTGAAARVARWDFKPTDAIANFGTTAGSRGYHFELPWPGPAPANKTLELFVRLKTADGRKFVANQTLQIDPPAGPRHGADVAAEEGDVRGGIAPRARMASRDRGASPRVFPPLRDSDRPGRPDASPAAPSEDGSLEVTVPDGATVAEGSSWTGVDGSSKSQRLIDRSRLRGGPGMFDGSRIRSITGSRDPRTPSGQGHTADGGDAPAYQGPAGVSSTNMPRVELPDSSTSDDEGPQMEIPKTQQPSVQTARPVWKPYR